MKKNCGVRLLCAGEIDYSIGIRGHEPLVHKWTNDLFEYYWKKAQPLEI